MVAGDLVNTASRLQSAARAGNRARGRGDPAGGLAGHRLRAGRRAGAQGQGEPRPGLACPAGRRRAGRPIAARRSRRRSSAATTSCGCSRTCSTPPGASSGRGWSRSSGPAGIGKTRLAWEFLKYVDGLVEQVWWHDGRSPGYGDGISFWALGEMVRARAGLLESDDEATTRAAGRRDARDARARRGRAPLDRAGAARAPGHRGGRRPASSCSGRGGPSSSGSPRPRPWSWCSRTSTTPTPGCSTSSTHLLEWSRSSPILRRHPRPPGAARAAPRLGRRASAASRRSTSSRCPSPRCASSWRASCPGSRRAAVRPIVARADGIPLYAVETVRMLLADGRLSGASGAYVPARRPRRARRARDAHGADRLPSRRPRPGRPRARLRTRSVLGQTFTRRRPGRRVRPPETAELEPRLRALVRREILLDRRRPALPRARPVRVRAGAHPRGRLQHAGASRTARRATSPRRGTSRASGSDELAGALAGHYLAAQANAPRGPRGATRSPARRGSRSRARPSAPRRSARTTRPSATSSRRSRSRPTRPIEAELLVAAGRAADHAGALRARGGIAPAGGGPARELGDRPRAARGDRRAGQGDALRAPDRQALRPAGAGRRGVRRPDLRPGVAALRSQLARGHYFLGQYADWRSRSWTPSSRSPSTAT